MAEDGVADSTEKLGDFGEKANLNENNDSGITMVDVLEEEAELEEDANAVLGGSDDQNCTYPSGYTKRQALYACETCIEDTQTLAGVCLACSYACHEGHRLFELYTKRNFRCDCGNSKFSSNPCKLYPDKEVLNVDNHYNQNFCGVYCTCSRPYPDPDDDIDDEMIQCIVCEDWYHGRHLGTPVPTNNEFGEMVCGQCMSKYSFLQAYAAANKHDRITNDCNDENAIVECTSDQSCTLEAQQLVNGYLFAKKGSETKECELGDLEIPSEKIMVMDSDNCYLNELSSGELKYTGGVAVFWPDGWRQKLCCCSKCKIMYMDKKIMFLLDEDDTVHSYEEQGKAKQSGQSRYDRGMQALSQLDRIRQVEAIQEYNDMKSELKDFLKNFAEKKRVVKKEDIDEFFSQMQARKRQRVEVSIPHFCR